MSKRSILILTLLALAGCDDRPNNTELCRTVYDALCTRSHECGTTESLNECTAYYREACRVLVLHVGVPTPTAEEEQACVDAIGGLPCERLDDPAELDACWFLRQPADGEGGDGDADGDVDGDVDGDAEGDGEISQLDADLGDAQTS